MKKVIIAQNILQDIEGHDTLFRRGHITLYSAQSSEEIIHLHGVEQADIIVTDYALPLMGAVKMCTVIRGDAKLKHVSIIVLGESSRVFEIQCREAGANVYLSKPLDTVALFSEVSELLFVPQRKSIRVLMRATVKGMEGTTTFFAASQDVSLSGMLLETDRFLKMGEHLTCAFNIAHSEVTAQCIVVREVKTASGRYQYGVNFLNLDTKSLVIIEHYVKAQGRK
jgi:CheY-like chemotaxis protein